MVIISTISLIILVGIFWGVVYQNSESRNLVFAFSAVAGVVFVFWLNMLFELKAESEKYVIQTQLSIFHDKPEVAQYFYPLSSNPRIHLDLKASQWLASTNPALFKNDPVKVMKDLMMYSFIGFLLSAESDWKRNSTRFVNMHRTSLRVRSDQKEDDAFISKEEIYKLMASQNNIYSHVDYDLVITHGLFLPPQSHIALSDASFAITNPFCTMSFQLEDSGSVWFGEPGSNIAHAETYPDGSPKHQTRYFNINVSIVYKGERAQNKNMKEYKKWANTLVVNAKNWFEIH